MAPIARSVDRTYSVFCANAVSSIASCRFEAEFAAPNLSDTPPEKRLRTLTGRIGGHTKDVPELDRNDGSTAEHAARQDTQNRI